MNKSLTFVQCSGSPPINKPAYLSAHQAAAIPSVPPAHGAQEEQAYVLSYIRNLAGVTGILTDGDQKKLPVGLTESMSDGIGLATIEYLTAHRYSISSQKIVDSAFKRSNTEEAFSAFLCGRGMSKTEAIWLWNFIRRDK